MLDILQSEHLTLNDMQKFHLALDKAKQFDTDFVRNVAYLTAEIGEALNAFRLVDYRLVDYDQDDEQQLEFQIKKQEVAEELADCLAYVVKLANYAQVDLEEAYVAKMSKNITREWPS